MNKFITSFLLIVPTFVVAKIELLDRIAIIVDDGVVMESQITDTIEDIEEGYRNQNIEIPVSYTHLRAHETDSYLV